MAMSSTNGGWWYGDASWYTATNSNNFTIKMPPSFTYVLDMPKHPDEIVMVKEVALIEKSKYLSWDFSWK